MTLPRNTILLGDVREQLATLPDNSIHCVITSPPYWSLRNYGHDGQLGLEPTLEEYIVGQVAVFEEVRRVLRPEGTLWLNMGDAYAANAGADRKPTTLFGPDVPSGWSNRNQPGRRTKQDATLKNKDLIGIPWRLALALQEDGWWLRCDIVWSKPNPMPESTRDRPTRAHEYIFLMTKRARYFYDQDAIREPLSKATHARISQANFANQTGGAKDYAKTGQGVHSTRRALENLAAKVRKQDNGIAAGVSRRYEGFNDRYFNGVNPKAASAPAGVKQNGSMSAAISGAVLSTRNKRSVWTFSPEASSEEHYAAFPRKLVEPCLFAGTSAYGACAECGAPYVRITEIIDHAGSLGASYHDHHDDDRLGQRGVPPAETAPLRSTTGWRPSCKHNLPGAGVEPCIVLDPYMGSGTTAIVAKKYGRDYIGIEINPAYVAMSERRIARQQRGFF